MAELGAFVGGLIPTLLISRLLLWLFRSWDGGATRLLVAHATSLILISFIAGMGMANGGAFAGASAVLTYALPQALWLIVDFVRRGANVSPQSTQNDNAAPSSSPQSYQGVWFAASIIGVVLLVALLIGTQPPSQQGYEIISGGVKQPWEYSWQEAPAEAPADAAAIEPVQASGVTPDQCADEIRRLRAAGYTRLSDADCIATQPGPFDDLINATPTPSE